MKTNKEWHATHRMPANANFETRVQWHLEHRKHCACRPIPPKLEAQMKAKGLWEELPPAPKNTDK